MIMFLIVLNVWLTLIMIAITFNAMGKYNIGGVPNRTEYKFYVFIGWLVLYFLWAWALGFVDISLTIKE